MTRWLQAFPPARVVLEVGTHSPWMSRLITELGHTPIVANARKVKAVSAAVRKSDTVDAETLARLGRVDPVLSAPVTHRGVEAQVDLAQLRSRDALVRCRTLLINHVRGTLKSLGYRGPTDLTSHTCAAKVAPLVPAKLRAALTGVFAILSELSERIRASDKALEVHARARYPETEALRQVTGVGVLTALAFMLTIEDPARFATSRSVGAYFGLVPGRRQSADHDPPVRITKTGDRMVRRLLVNAAHYILGPFGPPCDLRRWGEALIAPGVAHAKRRAVVAVARKLATVLRESRGLHPMPE